MIKEIKMKQLKLPFIYEDNKEVLGNTCPKCGHYTVVESGLEVCYYCGSYSGMEEENESNI